MTILQSLAGMGDMTEQVIATDFLISAKAGVRNYAMAISETTTPEVRDILRRHLDTAIDTHEKLLRFMVNKGYYHIYNPQEQIQADIKAANTVLQIQP